LGLLLLASVACLCRRQTKTDAVAQAGVPPPHPLPRQDSERPPHQPALPQRMQSWQPPPAAPPVVQGWAPVSRPVMPAMPALPIATPAQGPPPAPTSPPRRPAAPAQRSDSIDQDACVVCLDQKAIMAFVPCGHRCVCEGCSAILNDCPMCRAPKQSVVRIFT